MSTRFLRQLVVGLFVAFFVLAPTPVQAETKTINLDVGTLDVGGQYRIGSSDDRLNGSDLGYSVLCGGGKDSSGELRLGLATGGWKLFYPCDLFRTNNVAHIEIIPVGGDMTPTSMADGTPTNPIQIVTNQLTTATAIDTMQIFATDHLEGSVMAVQIWGNDGEYYASGNNNINSTGDNDNQALDDFCKDLALVSRNHHSSNDPKLRYCYSETGAGTYQVGSSVSKPFTGLKKIRITIAFGDSEEHAHVGNLVINSREVPPPPAGFPQCKGFNVYGGATASTATNLLTSNATVADTDFTKVIQENADPDGVMDRQSICWTSAGLSPAQYATGRAVFACQITCSKNSGELSRVETLDAQGNTTTVASSSLGLVGTCETRDATKSRGNIVAKNADFIAALPPGVQASARANGLLFVQNAWNYNDPPEGQFCSTSPYKQGDETGVIFNGGNGNEILGSRCGVAGNGNCTRRIQVTPSLACTATTAVPSTATVGTAPIELKCSASPGALSYKATIPANTSAGTPTTVILTPATPGGEARYSVPITALSPGTYPMTCIPCRDAGATDCASVTASCSTSAVVRSACALGDVSSVASTVNFAKNAEGQYDLLTVSWRQEVESPIKTDFYDLRFYPATGTGSMVGPIRVSHESARTSTAGSFAVVLDSQPIANIHSMLVAAGTSSLKIEVTPIEAGGATCPSAVGVAGTSTVETTKSVLIRVRETVSASSCSGGTQPSALGGTLKTTWPPSGSKSDVADFSVTVPTTASLTSTFTFANDVYNCNSCTPDNGTAGASKSCQKNSDATALEATLYVSSQNVSSWWQVIGGLAYGKDGIGSRLPLTAGVPDFCPEVSANSYDPRCAPFALRSSDFTIGNKAGIALSRAFSVASGWMNERAPVQYAQLPSTEKTINSLRTRGNSAYAYYLSLIPSDKQTPIQLSELRSLTDLPGFGPNSTKFYVTSGDLLIDPSEAITVGSGQKLVLFVPGSLTVGQNNLDPSALAELVRVETGGFLAVFVRGQMVVRRGVGTTLPTAGAPTPALGVGFPATNPLVKANLTGMYVVDGVLRIEGGTSTDGVDKRFIGEGTFASATGVELERSFSRDAFPYSKILSGYTPSEVFRHRPDMVLATPAELKEVKMQYQEIR